MTQLYTAEERAMFAKLKATGCNPTGAYWCTECDSLPRADGSSRCLNCMHALKQRLRPTKRIAWRKIREQYLYGEEGTCGPKKAEILRAYEDEWLVFPWVDGKQLTLPEGKELDGTFSYKEAKALAAKWLRE